MKKTMRRLCFALFLLLMTLACGMAAAVEALPSEVTVLFQSALPGHTISHSQLCGNTAAAVLTDGHTQTLCLAEQNNGAWELVVCNPAALRQDAAVTSLLLDTNDTLYWSYGSFGQVCDTYRATRLEGQWRMVSLVSRETHENGNSTESHTWYGEGRLNYASFFCDENDNVVDSRAYAPVPARWLDGLMPLSVYDEARFPKPNQYYTHSWLSDEATALAAAELFPEDTYLGGCAKEKHLEFFLQNPDGERIIAACIFHEGDGWQPIRSAPLPKGTTYGYENFSSSLVIGNLLVNIGPVDDNTCGITYIYNMEDMASGETMFRLGKSWVTDSSPIGYENCFGDHPWGDISAIDWNSLPRTFGEALSVLDTSNWAVVNNPNPEDRLHLRTEPKKTATSLGKYYNGTPVRIVGSQGEWVAVDIFGVTGWMMKEYLAFGEAGHNVEAAFPSRVFVFAGGYHGVFTGPSTDYPFVSSEYPQQDLLVLGIVGEEWYHVWFPEDDVTGYVLQSNWKEGNG